MSLDDKIQKHIHYGGFWMFHQIGFHYGPNFLGRLFVKQDIAYGQLIGWGSDRQGNAFILQLRFGCCVNLILADCHGFLLCGVKLFGKTMIF